MDQFTVPILDDEYTIIHCDQPLMRERIDAQIDHDQHVIWIDPSVSFRRMTAVIVAAVAQAWKERTEHLLAGRSSAA